MIFFIVTLALAFGSSVISYRIGRRQGGEWVAAQLEARDATLQLEVAINDIDGVVLPDPEDPRWELKVEAPPEYLPEGDKTRKVMYRLGDLRVWQRADGHVVVIADRGPGAWSYLSYPDSFTAANAAKRTKYFHALDKAWIARRVDQNIQGMP